MNSEFSFSWTSCLTKAEEPSLPYYLPIAGGRIIGFIPFPNVKCNQSRIWTRVAVSNSCDDNHYTTGFSPCCLPCISSYCYIWQMDLLIVWRKVGDTQHIASSFNSHLAFLPIRFVSVRVVHTYSSIDTATA